MKRKKGKCIGQKLNDGQNHYHCECLVGQVRYQIQKRWRKADKQFGWMYISVNPPRDISIREGYRATTAMPFFGQE